MQINKGDIRSSGIGSYQDRRREVKHCYQRIEYNGGAMPYPQHQLYAQNFLEGTA